MVTLMVLPEEMLHLTAAAPKLIQGKINVFSINSILIRKWFLSYIVEFSRHNNCHHTDIFPVFDIPKLVHYLL